MSLKHGFKTLYIIYYYYYYFSSFLKIVWTLKMVKEQGEKEKGVADPTKHIYSCSGSLDAFIFFIGIYIDRYYINLFPKFQLFSAGAML